MNPCSFEVKIVKRIGIDEKKEEDLATNTSNYKKNFILFPLNVERDFVLNQKKKLDQSM